MDDWQQYAHLDALHTAVHRFGLAYELLRTDKPEGDLTRLEVSGRGSGPWEIAVDEACGVFRWVSGPDAGGQVGPLDDPARSARAVAALFGIDLPVPPRT